MAADRMSIYYRPDDYNANKNKIYGRVSANAGFLKGVVQYGRRSTLSLYTDNSQHFNQFNEMYFSPSTTITKFVNPVYHGDIKSLEQSGLYFSTDPAISNTAWARSMINPSAFSICGLTHSISSISMIDEVCKLIIAPIQPWDALICTSTAAKSAMQEMFRQWQDYFNKQKNFFTQSQIQLPIIPLGIHTDDVSSLQNKECLRKEFRNKWQINEDDFIVLFLGRLSYYEKAHPIPMLLALQGLAERTGKKGNIYFIQAGWFAHDEHFHQYKQSADQFSPDVRHIILTELDEALKRQLYSSADVFISLSDNIQETFGITPLEAMANELPVIVSDWDGYKDTVRHGIDGFRIPTLLPPPGCGVDLGLGYLSNAINYYSYCGYNAQMTAIDIKNCVDALWQLYHSPSLRKQMGSAGRQRVLNTLDWKHIIKQYDELWDELTSIRLTVSPDKQQPLSYPPLVADPFQTYFGYGSMTLKSTHQLMVEQNASLRLQEIATNPLSHFGYQQRLPQKTLQSIIDKLKQEGELTVRQIIEFVMQIHPGMSNGVIARSLTYLMKYNVLSLKHTD